MPLLSIDCDAAGRPTGLDALDAALDALPERAAVIVMVHGYKYDPATARYSPHDQIFSLTPRQDGGRRVSWPARLGAQEGTEAPLCVAFGWPARGSIWSVWLRARAVAAGLARLMDRIAARRGRPAHAIAHSLGASVLMGALPQMAPGSLGRAVLLTGAALRAEAAAALDSPAGQRAEIVNVTSRENDVFDALFELALLRGASIGSGLGGRRNWLDLQLDHAATRSSLWGLGFAIDRPDGRVCHWSSYTRAGVFPLYRTLLDDGRRLPLGLLRAQLPERPLPRWCRFRPQGAPRLGRAA